MNQQGPSHLRQAGLMLGALGVVFGDIGTSPLYALRECFNGAHAVELSRANLLGILSLIFWSLALIVSLKYLVFFLRADNKGEGGILALLSLALRDITKPGLRSAMLALGIFGSTLLYGDGIITPAISVLGAVEGLKIAAPALSHYVVPISVIIIILLFAFQRLGTAQVGGTFGVVMILWFTALAILGARGILLAPEVLGALNPLHAIQFFLTEKWPAFVVLGSVVLVVTGGEALYADMGHFGVKPIRRCWFGFVLPALLLNYFGQGALLLHDATAAENPFYRLCPESLLLPMVALATCAAVIASQALISGAYSLTMHAVQLGFLPRLRIVHTSQDTRGQIYMPHVNWLLMIGCLALVLGFRTSSNLASAYGVAVTSTMATTTVLFYFVARSFLKWPRIVAAAFCAFFLAIELTFLGSNLLKVVHGGWFPLLVALMGLVLMTTWRRGRELLRQRLQNSLVPLKEFLPTLNLDPARRVKGTAIFMAGNPQGVPLALLHNLKHNKVLHQRIVLLTIVVEDLPRMSDEQRVEIETLAEGFFRVTARYGFMEQPDVPHLLKLCSDKDLKLKAVESTFFLSRETIFSSRRRGMARWRSWLFALMSRNAQPATDFFKLPPNRVVELGMYVEL
jgi:KUP system potassium uptake protein